MKILVTGSAGRVGRAIYIKLMKEHTVIGFDKTPCSTADFVGDIRDLDLLRSALQGVDAIVHTAALHAPHVGLVPESEFRSINVSATQSLMLEGVKQGIRHFVFTSTTALYGKASTPQGKAGWIDESVTPIPKSIYHETKIEAEKALKALSEEYNVPVTVLQMSRCFPEPADIMSIYRLNRGIDARDVANAHAMAIEKRLPNFRRFIISGATPFTTELCPELIDNAEQVLRDHAPNLVAEFDKRGWKLPTKLDRVYDSRAAQIELDWHPKYSFESVLDMFDNEMAEVLQPVEQS